MKCFEGLVQSKFMANARLELQQARSIVGNDPMPTLSTSYGLSRAEKRSVYYQYIDYMNILDYVADTPEEQGRGLNYIKHDHILFAFSRQRALIDNACDHSYKVNGDIPYFRGRHLVEGKWYHTVLIDTRFPVIPNSPN